MRKTGVTSGGSLLIEMSAWEWMAIQHVPFDHLGVQVRAYRRQHGLSQNALAKMVGLTRVEISMIETGKANYTLSTYLKIMAVIGG